MTDITTETAARRRYTGPQLDRIETCEAIEGIPFTDADLDQIDAYEQETAGIEDTLDPATAAALPQGWPMLAVISHFRDMLQMLKNWHDSISRLHACLADSRNCASRPSCAYIRLELLRWIDSREALLSAMASLIIGEDKDGYWPLPVLESTTVQHVDDGTYIAEMRVFGCPF